MRKTKLQLDIFHHQVTHPGTRLSCIYLSCRPKRLCGNSNHLEFLVTLHKLIVSIVEGITYTSHWPWKSWAGASLEPLLILTSVFDAGRHSACFQKRKVTGKTVTNPATYKIGILASSTGAKRRKCYGGNQPLSN